MKKVTIVMLTYNAEKYVEHSIRTIKKYTESNSQSYRYRLLVCDNASDNRTRKKLNSLKLKGYIDKLVFFEQNYYFVGGNNRAMDYVPDDTDYILLLNSDIEIRNSHWLRGLLDVHRRGITACQVCCETDCRPDGWCLLVDKDIFEKYKLDEKRFTWWLSIADFGSRVMKDGYSVQSIRNYKNFIRHFGGASEIECSVEKSGCEYAVDVDKWYPQKCDVIETLELNGGKKHYDVFFELFNAINRFIRKIM